LDKEKKRSSSMGYKITNKSDQNEDDYNLYMKLKFGPSNTNLDKEKRPEMRKNNSFKKINLNNFNQENLNAKPNLLDLCLVGKGAKMNLSYQGNKGYIGLSKTNGL